MKKSFSIIFSILVASFGLTAQCTAPITINLPANTAVHLGETYEFTVDTDVDISDLVEFEWTGPVSNPGGWDQEITVTDPVDFTLNIKDINGCEASASFTINVVDPYYPFANAFSPNQDGANDYFYIPKNPGFESIKQMYIYDRNGAMVFDGSASRLGDASTGWDGRKDDKLVEQGVYIVYVEVLLVDGVTKDFKGALTVVR